MRGLKSMIVLMGFMACSSVYPVGAENAPASLGSATLINPSDSHIWIMSIDGNRAGVHSHGQYQLEPGHHVIRVQYFWTRRYVQWTGNDLVNYPFDVKKGDALKVVCQHTEEPGSGYDSNDYYKGTWKFWIEDVSDGHVIAANESQPNLVRPATGEVEEPDYMFFRTGM
jgi:hypothetical protein